MKFHSAAALAAVLLSVAPLAHADSGPGWFLGYDFGKADASEPVLFPANAFGYSSGNSFYSTQLSAPVYEQHSSAHRLDAGYWFNSYLGIELSDADLGEHVAHANAISAPTGLSCGLPCENSFEISPRVTARGRGLALRAALPLPYGFRLMARFGQFYYHTEYDSGITGTASPPYGDANLPPGFHQETDGTANMRGIGIGWEFMEHWTASIWSDEYQDLSAGYPHFDVKFVSAGIEYRY